ncbi:unnamed protein product [Boreogadus saida]
MSLAAQPIRRPRVRDNGLNLMDDTENRSLRPALGTGGSGNGGLRGGSGSRHTSIVCQLSRLHTQVWEAVCRRGSQLRGERGGRVTGARSAAHGGAQGASWGRRNREPVAPDCSVSTQGHDESLEGSKWM